jgi:phage FluMu protein Com
MTTLGCKHCNAYKHLAVFRSKYDCPACGVYDEITGEA